MRFRCRSSSLSTSPPQLQTALACCCCHLGASCSSNCTATAEKARARERESSVCLHENGKRNQNEEEIAAFQCSSYSPRSPPEVSEANFRCGLEGFFCCCFQPLYFCHDFIDHTTPRSQVQQSAVSLKIYQFTRCVSKSIPGYHLGYKPSNSCGDELRWVNVLGSHLKEFMDTISHQQEPVQKVRRFKNMRRQSL